MPFTQTPTLEDIARRSNSIFELPNRPMTATNKHRRSSMEDSLRVNAKEPLLHKRNKMKRPKSAPLPKDSNVFERLSTKPLKYGPCRRPRTAFGQRKDDIQSRPRTAGADFQGLNKVTVRNSTGERYVVFDPQKEKEKFDKFYHSHFVRKPVDNDSENLDLNAMEKKEKVKLHTDAFFEMMGRHTQPTISHAFRCVRITRPPVNLSTNKKSNATSSVSARNYAKVRNQDFDDDFDITNRFLGTRKVDYYEMKSIVDRLYPKNSKKKDHTSNTDKRNGVSNSFTWTESDKARINRTEKEAIDSVRKFYQSRFVGQQSNSEQNSAISA